MNFYKRFVADIQVKTGHLTPAEFGIYDRLLDHYYATEVLLPPLDRCYAVARAMTKADKDAVARVLAEFFTEETGGLYSQRRADKVLAEALPKIEAARTNGKNGGRPRKPIVAKTETQWVLKNNPEASKTETQSAVSEKASQSQSISSPSSKKQRGDAPLKPPASTWFLPDWIPPRQWADFEAMRKAMRGVPFTDAARDGVIRELAKFKAMGHDAAALLEHAVTNGHRTVYEPRLGFHRSAPRDEDSIRAANVAANEGAKLLLFGDKTHA